MTQEEITQFLEDYRDGVIDPDGARRLAREIRSGGPGTNMVMEELALSGWISEALSKLDPESFVRSFLERLYAERSTDQFSSSLTDRLEKENGHKPRQDSKSSKHWLPLAVQMLFGGGAGDAALIRRQRRRLAAIVSVMMLTVTAATFAVVWVYIRGTVPATVAVIENASAGTAFTHNRSQLSAAEGAALRAGDQLETPAEGYARINLAGIGPVVLTADTLMVFEAPRKGESGTSACIEVKRGEAIVQHIRETSCQVNSPHALVTAAEPAEFTITVTTSSTRAKATHGTIQFMRHTDGKTVRIPAGHYAIATESANFEIREVRP